MTMNEPTFDKDGYPTEETLERIATWPIETVADMHAAMDFAGSAWSYPDRWETFEEINATNPAAPERVYRFSTGGWSGNESIVGAIERNLVLQMMGAYSWQRGGHYVYRFPAREFGE